jgi:predicted PurR-regulated permease PerM
MEPQERVPLRSIAVAIAMVLGTVVLLLLAWKMLRVLTWIAVSAFLAVVVGPAVDVAERRLRLARALATLLVFLLGVLVLAGLVTLMVRPLAQEGSDFAKRVPDFVDQARTGRGPVGRLVTRYHVDEYVQRNQSQIRATLSRFSQPAIGVLRRIFTTVVALLAILVLTFLMVLQGPKLLAAWLSALPPPRRERVRRVAADSSKAITGYVTGNLLISVIAGVLTYLALLILGVPFPGVVGLFVGFTDLIPLIGATLGAVAGVVVAALHSPVDGLIVLVFFIAYQQFENHVLQPMVLSRTVELTALTVLMGLLLGVELAGFLGALLAIPLIGVGKVVWRDLYDHYHGRLKFEPTLGTDEVPASQAPPEMEPAEPAPDAPPAHKPVDDPVDNRGPGDRGMDDREPGEGAASVRDPDRAPGEAQERNRTRT